MASITVDIWSDIACPWCYIGKRKFEAGLADFAGRDDVEVTYHSFELAPDTPVDFDGSEIDFLVQHKEMPAGQVRQMLDQVSAIADEVGLRYNFDALLHTNTRKAHELLHYAKQHGKQLEMAERLFAAYFSEGRHLGRDEELAELGADVGLDRGAIENVLAAGDYVSAVDADIAQAREYGINGVPFFVIDGRYGVSGAQAPETFTSVLERARDEVKDVTADV
ncbi:DsbA family protein [Williamsia sp. DF01-3]|uniref:DsbA family oxidoreductase n=1 Tax=Williamsia sp. DF01-3 TaxID=2934157 RepID=UPI001FF1F167|nr:DsbA family oxidoreductase [Williamsia sp. DF01-3]MCK0517123.1 DsbA family oxidoreductase [Williamsia sp. DF01-3]